MLTFCSVIWCVLFWVGGFDPHSVCVCTLAMSECYPLISYWAEVGRTENCHFTKRHVVLMLSCWCQCVSLLFWSHCWCSSLCKKSKSEGRVHICVCLQKGNDYHPSEAMFCSFIVALLLLSNPLIWKCCTICYHFLLFILV